MAGANNDRPISDDERKLAIAQGKRPGGSGAEAAREPDAKPAGRGRVNANTFHINLGDGWRYRPPLDGQPAGLRYGLVERRFCDSLSAIVEAAGFVFIASIAFAALRMCSLMRSSCPVRTGGFARAFCQTAHAAAWPVHAQSLA